MSAEGCIQIGRQTGGDEKRMEKSATNLLQIRFLFQLRRQNRLAPQQLTINEHFSCDQVTVDESTKRSTHPRIHRRI